jgi:REP element-mobilizing transposase RayT
MPFWESEASGGRLTIARRFNTGVRCCVVEFRAVGTAEISPVTAMAHTYVSELIHCVFSTKQRRNLISAEIQPQLWSFLGGIARKNGFKALMVGGTENHVHILLSLPATMPLAKAMQLIKGASSHWMNETFKTDLRGRKDMAPSPSESRRKNDTIAYIQNQAEHHRKRNFEEEFLAFLKKNDVEYDPQHVWG